MNAYIFQAGLLCEECAKQQIIVLYGFHAPDTGDSGDYPQGPYANGGGESDSPSHCDHCGLFLENALTSEGEAYVRDEIINHSCKSPDSRILEQWRAFYAYLFTKSEEGS